MIFIVFSCACLFVDKVDTKSVKTMKKAKNLLRSSLNRIRLEEEVYDLYRVQNLPISVVMEKPQCCTSSATMQQKFGKQCCARAKAYIFEGRSMHLRLRKHASESAKALIQGCESIDSGVRKDASEGVGALHLLL